MQKSEKYMRISFDFSQITLNFVFCSFKILIQDIEWEFKFNQQWFGDSYWAFYKICAIELFFCFKLQIPHTYENKKD